MEHLGYIIGLGLGFFGWYVVLELLSGGCGRSGPPAPRGSNRTTDDGIYILTLDDLVRVKRLSVSMATGNVLIESNDGRKSEELPLREVPGRLHIQGRVLGSWSLRSFA